MSALALLGHQGRRHRGALLATALGLFVFAWALTGLAPGPGDTEAFQNLLQFIPPALRQMFPPELLANVTGRGFIAFTSFLHPVVLILMAVWVVRVGAAGLAGEIGSGTMDLLASRPIPRGLPVAVTYAWLVIGLGVLTLVIWIGIAAGLASRPDLMLNPAPFLAPAGMLLLLYAAFGAVALALSAATRAGGSWAAGVVAASFGLDYLARLWEAIAWSRPFSLFRYFRPQEIMTTGVQPVDVMVLAGVAIAGLFAALVIFQRRDL